MVIPQGTGADRHQHQAGSDRNKCRATPRCVWPAPRHIGTVDVRAEGRIASATRCPSLARRLTRRINRLAGFEREIDTRPVALTEKLRQLGCMRRRRNTRRRRFRRSVGLRRAFDPARHQASRLGFSLRRRRRPRRRSGGRPWRFGARRLRRRAERRLGLGRPGRRPLCVTTQWRQHQIRRGDQQFDDRVAPVRVADRRLPVCKSALDDVGNRADFAGTYRYRHNR